MKFIHTADWHLGKVVHGKSMIEDQHFILQKLIKLIEIEKPDALVIAGDLYDRSVPPASAVNLLNETLYQINIEMNVPIVAIAGNHDSADRLHFGSTWFQKSQFYLTGKLEKKVFCPQIDGVFFHCIPYAEPGMVRHLLDDDSIRTHHDAMHALTGRISETMDHSGIHIAVGHAFVTGGDTCDSERILSVGGSGNVGADVFAPFHYTALGHLHNPDAIRHSSVQYAGSLLKYSFSEVNHGKSVAIVEVNEQTKTVQVTKKALTPLRELQEWVGSFDELMERDPTEDYVKVVLTDEGALLDPMAKLKKKFPHILHLEKAVRKPAAFKPAYAAQKQKSDIELFGEFYTAMTDLSFSEEKQAYMASVLKEIEKGRMEE